MGLTDSECVVAAKNATLQANGNNTAPADVWNYCATGVCNFTMPNGTIFTFISPYAGSHTDSICQLGYSSAVDNNEYVEPALLTGTGQATADQTHLCLPILGKNGLLTLHYVLACPSLLLL